MHISSCPHHMQDLLYPGHISGDLTGICLDQARVHCETRLKIEFFQRDDMLLSVFLHVLRIVEPIIFQTAVESSALMSPPFIQIILCRFLYLSSSHRAYFSACTLVTRPLLTFDPQTGTRAIYIFLSSLHNVSGPLVLSTIAGDIFFRNSN
jgi:hypothetical protein